MNNTSNNNAALKVTAEEKKAFDSKRSLASIAYAFMIVATITLALFLPSLAWMIPMTLKAKFHSEYPKLQTCVALGVCSIIFGALFGIIAGILLIIADSHTRRFILLKKHHKKAEQEQL